MKTLYTGILVSLILMIVGCSTRTAILMEEYKGQKITGKDLMIIKLFENPSIANEDDVIDDLGPGIPNEVYTSFFNERFVDAFQISNCCNTVNYIINISNLDLEERTLDINNEWQMKIMLPKETAKIEIDTISSDFVLFIDDLQVFRKSGQSGYWVGGTYSGGSFGGLYHQIHFAMWDNINGKLVSYGIVDAESTVVFGMTEGDWKFVIKGLATKILEYSPFPVPRVIYH